MSYLNGKLGAVAVLEIDSRLGFGGEEVDVLDNGISGKGSMPHLHVDRDVCEAEDGC